MRPATQHPAQEAGIYTETEAQTICENANRYATTIHEEAVPLELAKRLGPPPRPELD